MGKIIGFFAGKQTLGFIAVAIVLFVFSMGVIKVYDWVKVNKLERTIESLEVDVLNLEKKDSVNTVNIKGLIGEIDTCNLLYKNMEAQYQTQVASLNNRALFAERKYNEIKDGGCTVITLNVFGKVKSKEWASPCPY